MTAFVLVSHNVEVPNELPRYASRVNTPDFNEDIEELKYRPPVDKIMTANYLRAAMEYISRKYDDDFSGVCSISVNEYVGVPFAEISDVAKMVLDIVKMQQPSLIDKYIEKKLRELPYGTKVVYFQGSHLNTAAFDKLGMSMISSKDAEAVLGIGEKKIAKAPVSKRPAPTESK